MCVKNVAGIRITMAITTRMTGANLLLDLNKTKQPKMIKYKRECEFLGRSESEPARRPQKFGF